MPFVTLKNYRCTRCGKEFLRREKPKQCPECRAMGRDLRRFKPNIYRRKPLGPKGTRKNRIWV